MKELLESIMNKLKLVVGRCVIIASRYDAGDLGVDIELTASEKRRQVELLQQYGFISRPVGSVSGLALFVGGNRANGVVVACNGEESSMKKQLEPGEVCMISPHGQQIYLKKDGSIAMVSGNGVVDVDGVLRATKGLETDGPVKAGKDVIALVNTPGQVGLSTHIHQITVGPSGVGPSNPPQAGT